MCSDCVCRYCLHYWSERCPYGDCYDDHRAAVNPYDAAHPAKPPRTHWSNWEQPGEQAHWCRGGALYPSTDCEHFIQYEGQKVSDCYRAVVSEFQDGYIDCSVREAMSCEACMKDMTEKLQGRKQNENTGPDFYSDRRFYADRSRAGGNKRKAGEGLRLKWENFTTLLS